MSASAKLRDGYACTGGVIRTGNGYPPLSLPMAPWPIAYDSRPIMPRRGNTISAVKPSLQLIANDDDVGVVERNLSDFNLD